MNYQRGFCLLCEGGGGHVRAELRFLKEHISVSLTGSENPSHQVEKASKGTPH